MTTSENPYASPQYQPPPPPERPVAEEPKPLPSLQKSFLKWTLACGLAAGPSFFFAMSLVHKTGYMAACGGMVAGVAAFIVLYVFVERTQRVQRILSWRFARRTAWIGYGTRIAASIIFPIGMFPDVFCGIFAVGIGQWFLGGQQMAFGNHQAINGGEQVIVFVQFMMTTIVQGVLLNVVLFGYMILVFGICHLFGSFTRKK